MTWNEVAAAIEAAELASVRGRRVLVTQVWCEDDRAPATYNGVLSDAPVARGAPAYRLNTGAVIALA